MGDASWIEQRRRMGFRQGANWGNGRTISLTLSRSVYPAGVLFGADRAAGGIRASDLACPTSRPIASLHYLHRPSYPSDHALQYHLIFALRVDQAFVTQVHVPRAGFLLGALCVPRSMGRPCHATRGTTGERTQGRLACTAWRVPAQLPRVYSRPQTGRNGEGWRDRDGMRRCYNHGMSSSRSHV